MRKQNRLLNPIEVLAGVAASVALISGISCAFDKGVEIYLAATPETIEQSKVYKQQSQKSLGLLLMSVTTTVVLIGCHETLGVVDEIKKQIANGKWEINDKDELE